MVHTHPLPAPDSYRPASPQGDGFLHAAMPHHPAEPSAAARTPGSNADKVKAGKQSHQQGFTFLGGLRDQDDLSAGTAGHDLAMGSGDLFKTIAAGDQNTQPPFLRSLSELQPGGGAHLRAGVCAGATA